MDYFLFILSPSFPSFPNPEPPKNLFWFSPFQSITLKKKKRRKACRKIPHSYTVAKFSTSHFLTTWDDLFFSLDKHLTIDQIQIHHFFSFYNTTLWCFFRRVLGVFNFMSLPIFLTSIPLLSAWISLPSLFPLLFNFLTTCGLTTKVISLFGGWGVFLCQEYCLNFWIFLSSTKLWRCFLSLLLFVHANANIYSVFWHPHHGDLYVFIEKSYIYLFYFLLITIAPRYSFTIWPASNTCTYLLF